MPSYAEKCGMPYVNERWLGGMLTNFETISKRVGKMLEYERMRDSGEFEAMPKKEALLLTRELEKLQRNLGGLRGMSKLPDAVFVLDTKKEHIAVTEANKLGIPVVAVVDTNVDPDVDPVPDPRQRRRDPRQRAARPRDRRGRRGGPLHRRHPRPGLRRAVVPAAEERPRSPSAGRGPQCRRRRRPSAKPASRPPRDGRAAPSRPRRPPDDLAVEPDAVAAKSRRGRSRASPPTSESSTSRPTPSRRRDDRPGADTAASTSPTANAGD